MVGDEWMIEGNSIQNLGTMTDKALLLCEERRNVKQGEE